MDLEDIKKYFGYLMIVGGLFVVIFLIYTTFLISRYALKKPQNIKKSYAEEEAVTPIPSPTAIQRIRIE
ncbi:hypothetical protein HZA76_02585 [Candidatus Roizmanbacteria bacterium]|nr:hypothetical protein [Candidatus Roizmanbacteria bacterium]